MLSEQFHLRPPTPEFLLTVMTSFDENQLIEGELDTALTFLQNANLKFEGTGALELIYELDWYRCLDAAFFAEKVKVLK